METPQKPSFVKIAYTPREAVLAIEHQRVLSKFQQKLKEIDDFVKYCEDRVNLGIALSVAGSGKIYLRPEDYAEHFGPDLFGELQRVAVDGRAFLDSLGYKSKASTAPAAFLEGNNGTVALTQPFQSQTPGEPPLNGTILSTFDKPTPDAE